NECFLQRKTKIGARTPFQEPGSSCDVEEIYIHVCLAGFDIIARKPDAKYGFNRLDHLDHRARLSTANIYDRLTHVVPLDYPFDCIDYIFDEDIIPLGSSIANDLDRLPLRISAH